MFQPCPIWDDNSLSKILKLVNTLGMDEIELYLELVRVKPQVNQSLGTYTDLLLGGNNNVEELDYWCGPSSASIASVEELSNGFSKTKIFCCENSFSYMENACVRELTRTRDLGHDM